MFESNSLFVTCQEQICFAGIYLGIKIKVQSFANTCCSHVFYFFQSINLYFDLGCNQLFSWFVLAIHPNLEFKNPTFLGGKMEFRQLPKCGYKDRYIFYATLCNYSFFHQLISYCDIVNVSQIF